MFRSLYPDAFGNLYSFEKNEYNHTDSTESIRLVKMNSQGDVTNTLFQTYFGPWYGLNIANVIPDKEGNVLFGFTTYINNVRKFVLQKYDKDFQQIFYREFIPDNYLWASQVDNFVLDDAGNIFLSGMVMDIDPRKIFLCNMLIDANGNLVWEPLLSD